MKNLRTTPVEFDTAQSMRETDEAIILPAILARECVADYCNGRGYKPGLELRAAAFTLNGVLVVPYEHVPGLHVEDRSLARGQVHDVTFDDKINAIRGDVWFLKNLCEPELLQKARSGNLPKDVSCGYQTTDIAEKGVFGADTYDFKQTNLLFGHVAVGVPEGRCPGPYCGFQSDTPAGFLRVNVRPKENFACRLSTLTVNAEKGIYALVGKLKKNLLPSGYASGDALEQDYLFETSRGWTQEKAQVWLKNHKDSAKFIEFTTRIRGIESSCDARSKLNPTEVLAKSHRLLSEKQFLDYEGGE